MKSIVSRTLRAAAWVVMLGAAPAALAQSSACVHLLVGAGYAAKMRIVSGSFHTDWSGSFPIGKTQCQSLSGVAEGKPFSVEVSAILGETKTCQPANVKRGSGDQPITFFAHGTTFNVKCSLPDGSVEQQQAATTPNADGAAAAGKLNAAPPPK